MGRLKVIDCFAGIGGFSLGLERAGFETVAFCEIEPYCQKVLAKHWPEVPIYDDIRRVTADRLIRDGIRPDVITGGFPCQDLSAAGKQAGIDGERSGLWAELARLIGELQPRYAIMENVTNLISGDSGRWFGRVLGDLAEVGYDAEWHCVPASAIGAPHRRDRVWLLAYPNGVEWEPRAEEQGILRDLFENGAVNDNAGRSSQAQDRGWWATEPAVCRVANGIPNRSHRLKALGNAVVPQIPELIGHAIMEAERGY
jgi:DNA (cytosine-5)-methyltransferase 1